MVLNYEPLKKFIEEVNLKNTDLSESKLLSVSVYKKFIPASKNAKRENFKNYKIVKPNQFVFNPVISNNDNKIAIALLKDENVIVSNSYKVFAIKDTSVLNPEYLMFLFEHPDFDKYACFKSHGVGKTRFSWNSLCNTEIPMISIDKQNKIVDIVDLIEERIRIKEKINNVLEEFIQLIFNRFFVEFKDFSINTSDETMLGFIPYGWKTVLLGDEIKCILGNTPSRSVDSYWEGSVPWISSTKLKELRILDSNEFISDSALEECWIGVLPEKSVVIACNGSVSGHVSLLEIEACANQNVVGLVPNENFPYEFIYPLVMEIVRNRWDVYSEKKLNIKKSDLESEIIIMPPIEVISDYLDIVSPLFDRIADNCFEIKRLLEFKRSTIYKFVFDVVS